MPTRILLRADASAAARGFVGSLAGWPPAAPARSALLRALYAAALTDIAAERRRRGVADLPLVEVPALHPRPGLFAILYSGDGGWRDLDRSLAEILAADGLNVVGVDVLRYFWRPRTPEHAALDLGRIMQTYQREWDASQVVLIGFSFGADVLPFLANRLPAALRANLRLMTLLAPERSTAFEVSPVGWIGKPGGADHAVAPELAQLSALRIQCFYGEKEAHDSLCTTPAAATPNVTIVRKSGGHHFDHDYGALAHAILAAAGE